MNPTLTQRFSTYLVYLLPLSIFIFGVLMIQSSAYQQNPELMSLAITVDFLLTAPLLHFLLIRKKDLPKITVISFIVIGTIVASFVLPEQDQFYLGQFKTWFIPVLELGVFTFLFIQIRKTVKAFKSQKNHSTDFIDVLRVSTKTALGESRPAQLLATEVAVIYYALFRWKKTPLTEGVHFTNYRKNGASSLYIALICILGIEVLPMHILLEKWNVVVAWIFTFGGLYAMIQVLAHLKALKRRPIQFEDNQLVLRNGLMADTSIPYDQIEAFGFSNRKMTIDETTRALSILPDLDAHNLFIEVKTPGVIEGPYGSNHQYTRLLFFVDDKMAFKDLLELKVSV